ncbi:MAG: dihydroorotate dehydrogenase (quinone) [Meiothermus sp.]
MYALVKPLLFRQNPEAVHDLVMAGLEFAGQHRPLLQLIAAFCRVQDARLGSEVFGLYFPNPIGLAAGLDKNALAVPVWPALGFGFVEIGSVTALAQPGNPKPRLFRLPQDEALINRMGFNNQGAEAVAQRLERLYKTGGKPAVPLGINLGKSKLTPLEEAPQDYLHSLQTLWEYGDYFAVNVSSPNTPGLRQLQDRERLEELLAALTDFTKTQPQPKPLLLKIAPDLTWEGTDEILELAERYGLSGIIATNTTTGREGLKTPVDEAGGLSGRPLRSRSLEVLRYLRRHTALPIVSVGGIFTAEDVLERLQSGAALVQLYTAFIYEGPTLLRRLCQGLLRAQG